MPWHTGIYGILHKKNMHVVFMQELLAHQKVLYRKLGAPVHSFWLDIIIFNTYRGFSHSNWLYHFCECEKHCFLHWLARTRLQKENLPHTFALSISSCEYNKLNWHIKQHINASLNSSYFHSPSHQQLTGSWGICQSQGCGIRRLGSSYISGKLPMLPLP